MARSHEAELVSDQLLEIAKEYCDGSTPEERKDQLAELLLDALDPKGADYGRSREPGED